MKVFPVVHVTEPEVSSRQADLAFDLGADGVYLIDMTARDPAKLFETFNRVKKEHQSDFVGINPLGAGDALASLKMIKAAYEKGVIKFLPNGLWVDNARLRPGIADYEALKTYRDRHPDLKGVKVLGGVAFKYTRDYTSQPEDAAAQAAEAAPYLDVLATSGEGTGRPPMLDKIRAMKEASSSRIAIASGIDPGNIRSYTPYVDEVLVATSIETAPNSGIFEPETLRRLVEAAHAGSSGREA